MITQSVKWLHFSSNFYELSWNQIKIEWPAFKSSLLVFQIEFV